MKKRGAAYPVELRERVVGLVDGGRPHEEVADMMRLGVATIRRWLRARRERRDLAPLPHGGGRSAGLDSQDELALRALVEEKPDRTIAELTQGLAAKRKKAFSTSSVSRALQRLDLVLKKSRLPRASATGLMSKKPGLRSQRNSRRSTGDAATSSMRLALTSR